RDITVVGHSMGAEIGIWAAVRHAARVRALVIVDGGPELHTGSAQYLMHQLADTPRRFATVAEYAQMLLARLPAAESQVLIRFASHSLKTADDDNFELKYDPAILTRFSPTDSVIVWQLLRQVRCPVLVVRGARSALLPARAAALVASNLPRARCA